MPIFTIETVLDTTQDEWKVCHNPDHPKLKKDIENLLDSVIQATSVVKRVEGVFRKDRQAILDGYRKLIDDADRAGTQSGIPDSVQVIIQKVYGSNYANLTKDEQHAAWEKQFKLPSSRRDDKDYYDKVKDSKDIVQIKEHIKSVVDAIQQKMEEDCKMWQVSNEIRHLSSLRTHRGQMRFLKGAQSGAADDAVNKYKNGIEALKEIVDEVRHNRKSDRNVQFIVFQCSNMKTELMEQVGSDGVREHTRLRPGRRRISAYQIRRCARATPWENWRLRPLTLAAGCALPLGVKAAWQNAGSPVP